MEESAIMFGICYFLAGAPGIFGRPIAAQAGANCGAPCATWTAQKLEPALLGMEPAGKLLFVPPKLGMTLALTVLTLFNQNSPTTEAKYKLSKIHGDSSQALVVATCSS